jgi:hypothetical protein
MLVVIVPQKLLQLVMEKQQKLLQPLRHLHLQLLQPLRHLHLQLLQLVVEKPPLQYLKSWEVHMLSTKTVQPI